MATAWRKLIYSGSDAELNNLDVLKASGSFSGSFQGEVVGTMDSASVAITAQTASVALRANALSPLATASFADTATSASIATTSQTASVALRANALAPTVTATSASTAVLAQTASVALRANALAPTVTATSASTAVNAQTASVALRANSLASTVTASFADKANVAVTSNVIPVTVVNDGGNKYQFNGVTAPNLSLNKGELYRFDQSDSTNNNHPLRFRLRDDTSYAVGVNAVGVPGNAGAYVDFKVTYATSQSLKYYCTVHGNGMGNTIQLQNLFDTISSGSFSGSYQGDGSSLTGLATTLTVDGDSGTGDVNLTTDDLRIIGTTNEITTVVAKSGTNVTTTISLPDDITVGQDITVTRNATVGGNLIVNGSIVSASSLAVADQFIILASGSNGAIDGGIIINQIDDDPDGKGQAFAYDSSANRWALETGLNDSASIITPDAFMGVIQEGTSAPSSAPIYGAANGFGTVFVDSNTSNIYIWA